MPIPSAPTITSGVKYHIWAANKFQAQPGVAADPIGRIQRIMKVGSYRVESDTTNGGLSGTANGPGAFATVWYDASDNTMLVDYVSANTPVDDARDDAFSTAP